MAMIFGIDIKPMPANTFHARCQGTACMSRALFERYQWSTYVDYPGTNGIFCEKCIFVYGVIVA